MNLLAKRDKNAPWLIYDFMITSMSKSSFEDLKSQHIELLGEYDMLPKNDIDYTWWFRATRKLTTRKIIACGVEVINGKVVTY